jgi:hypothetical protein
LTEQFSQTFTCKFWVNAFSASYHLQLTGHAIGSPNVSTYCNMSFMKNVMDIFVFRVLSHFILPLSDHHLFSSNSGGEKYPF